MNFLETVEQLKRDNPSLNFWNRFVSHAELVEEGAGKLMKMRAPFRLMPEARRTAAIDMNTLVNVNLARNYLQYQELAAREALRGLVQPAVSHPLALSIIQDAKTSLIYEGVRPFSRDPNSDARLVDGAYAGILDRKGANWLIEDNLFREYATIEANHAAFHPFYLGTLHQIAFFAPANETPSEFILMGSNGLVALSGMVCGEQAVCEFPVLHAIQRGSLRTDSRFIEREDARGIKRRRRDRVEYVAKLHRNQS